MNLKSLKIFCDIVSRRSFSRAAEDNGISQSGASQVVSQLENRLVWKGNLFETQTWQRCLTGS